MPDTVTTRLRRAAPVGAPRAPRAGEIGPVRREIIFEPVHERPVPLEPAPAPPDTQPEQPSEPVPAAP
jgi:hypothetical protein